LREDSGSRDNGNGKRKTPETESEVSDAKRPKIES
jgi:hypothetical protein